MDEEHVPVTKICPVIKLPTILSVRDCAMKWTDFPGHKLIKSIHIMINGNILQTYRRCRKCDRLYTIWTSKDIDNFCLSCFLNH